VGKTALYHDPVPFRRAHVQLEADVLVVEMPDGWTRRHILHGAVATINDGCVARHRSRERRFVRTLTIERAGRIAVVITPPEQGAVAPNVVNVPEAPTDAAIVDTPTWEALAEWLVGGGRLAACSISDLARLACIATPQFAVLIGEVAAQRALDLVWIATHPMRSMTDLDAALQPLVDAARYSPRASDALVSALSHAAGSTRRR
jgi:hypothetical protein